MDATSGPLAGFTVVSLAGNVPGPVASQLLAADGAAVVKVEGPNGDMLAGAAPAFYDALRRGVDVRRIDLRTDDGRAALDALLGAADLLLTSQRPSALARLGIDAARLAAAHPSLCWVEIVGDADAPEEPGHDLTYQLQAGLLAPPAMPRTLLADVVGAHVAARQALALLLGRARGGGERHRRLGLRQAAQALTGPLRHGLTAPGGWLGGGQPRYGLYRLRDGWAGVAALEPHFAQRLDAVTDGWPLQDLLAGWTVADCMVAAHRHDLPIHAVVDRPDGDVNVAVDG